MSHQGLFAGGVPTIDLRKLRRKIRQQRRQLDPLQQKRAASRLCKSVTNSTVFQRSRHIAFYLPSDGEIDPTLALEEACRRKKICYLPVLAPLSRQLLFVRYKPGDTLVLNRFGIPEPNPLTNQSIKPWALDLVVTPLVAFDAKGARLGMGGGYYDRSFAFLKRSRIKKPTLLGVAHQLQRHPTSLPEQPWDVPLDKTLTD